MCASISRAGLYGDHRDTSAVESDYAWLGGFEAARHGFVGEVSSASAIEAAERHYAGFISGE